MREAFDQQLQDLMERLLRMGALTERMLRDAVAGLMTPEQAAFDRVMKTELQVNEEMRGIDRLCVQITVERQPVARDVRMVFASGRIAANIERIADQTVNLVENAAFVHQDMPAAFPVEIGQLGDASTKMLGEALAAMITRDTQLAEQVIAQEPAVDAVRDGLFDTQIEHITRYPSEASPSVSILLIAQNLERVADHATNIARQVLYLEGR